MRYAGVVGLVACILATCCPPVRSQELSDKAIIESQKLPRFPALEPGVALESFEIASGFRMELVAAEPLVMDPVAFCFDARGRLIVVEMRGYSERADSLTGRVRRLTDRDGDGRMDEVETLVDSLAWPTAVASWGDGVLVGVAPNIIMVSPAEEGNQPEVSTIFEGFGKSNVQGLMNSFRWGPDLRLHGATSSSGATLTGSTIDEPLRVGRQDFSIRYPSGQFSIVPGGGQHGLDFDRWGNKFVCSNSDHLQQVLLMGPRAGRAQVYSFVPPMRRSIAVDGPQAEVFRISPVEPWRILRTHLRVTGQARGPIEGGGRAAGYFTGSTGVLIYGGDQWGANDEIALVCDVGSNLIHRKRLTRNGLWFSGQRIDEGTEFVRSTDTWFRPVQLGRGPDGALYVADMYREVIEHPKSLPPVIKSQVDLNSGNDRGRIWRIVSTDNPSRKSLSKPLDAMNDLDLIELLNHANDWQRRMAARLLVTRELGEEAISRLRRVAVAADLPESRLEAVAVLGERGDGFDTDLAGELMRDGNEDVRRRAIRYAADHVQTLGSPDDHLLALLAQDESLAVLFQFAHDSVALVSDPQLRGKTLASIANRDLDDAYLRWAIEGSLGDALPVFVDAFDFDLVAGDREAWADVVAFQLLRFPSSEPLQHLLQVLEADATSAGNRTCWIEALARRVGSSSSTESSKALTAWVLENVLPKLSARVAEGDTLSSAELAELKLIASGSRPDSRRLLTSLIDPRRPAATQIAAVRSLVVNDRQCHDVLIENIHRMSPAVQEAAWETIATHTAGLSAVVESVEMEKLQRSLIPKNVVQALGSSRDSSHKALGQALAVPETPVDFESYRLVIQTKGSATAGGMLFAKHCASCHRPEKGAHRVGPELKSLKDKTVDQIGVAILDPNREVDPKYVRVQILTVDGTLLTGIVTEEVGATLSLVDEKGKLTQVSRSEVEDFRTMQQSLMPNDFRKHLAPAQMRDLITYLKQEIDKL